MYISKNQRGYTKASGEQCIARDDFLLFVQDKTQACSRYNFRALIRSVALHQCGNWMMGTARVKNQSLTVSGSYGGDGLPMSVDPEIFNMAIPVPEVLYEAWAHGGGWNGAGSEAGAMRTWAWSLMMRQKTTTKAHRKAARLYGMTESVWVTCIGVVGLDGAIRPGSPIFMTARKRQT